MIYDLIIIGMGPAGVSAAIYAKRAGLNVLCLVEGPYPFLMVYNQPILQSILWIIIIYAITYAIALILKKVNGKVII